MADSNIAAVVLAVPPVKPATTYNGSPVLAAVLETVSGWGLDGPVIVVFSSATAGLLDAIELGEAIAVLDEDGSSLSSALSVGLDAVTRVSDETSAAFIVYGDTPDVPSATADALVESLTSTARLAAAPMYRYVRAGPVLVARQLWDRLMATDTDQRLEEMLAAHPEWTSTVVISRKAPQPIG